MTDRHEARLDWTHLDRSAWEATRTFCWMCGWEAGRQSKYAHVGRIGPPPGLPVLSTHHIVYRSNAPGRWEQPANWLRACQACHDKLHRLPGGIAGRLPVALAHKLHYDPEHFSLRAVRQMLDAGRGAVVVTMKEILRVDVPEHRRFPPPPGAKPRRRR